MIRSKTEIEASKPKFDEYTINLMWVKAKPDGGRYIFRDKDLEANLNKSVAWASKNPLATVVIWYDSAMVDEKAVANTLDVLDRISPKNRFPGNVRPIIFKDLRQFPEILDNPSVFSDKTPVYFRVDLMRVIAAYNVLKTAQKRHYFAYADVDVTPMGRDELFDASTQMDLDRYAIVMAAGGINEGKFENSFQIWSNNKPNLLAAAKAAIIDINIMRAQNILEGGSWASKPAGDTEPLTQQVYDSYPPMFRFFYNLEGWVEAYSPDTATPDPDETESAFGLEEINPLSIKKIYDDELRFHDNGFLGSGKEFVKDRLYFPRKIIEAPFSQHGGRPTRFNPEEITPRNYPWKLYKAFNSGGSFDGRLLLIAKANNYDSVSRLIKEKLKPEELAAAESVSSLY